MEKILIFVGGLLIMWILQNCTHKNSEKKYIVIDNQGRVDEVGEVNEFDNFNSLSELDKIVKEDLINDLSQLEEK